MIPLDTIAVSELRKARPSSRVMAWASRHREEDFFISVLTIGVRHFEPTRVTLVDPFL